MLYAPEMLRTGNPHQSELPRRFSGRPPTTTREEAVAAAHIGKVDTFYIILSADGLTERKNVLMG